MTRGLLRPTVLAIWQPSLLVLENCNEIRKECRQSRSDRDMHGQILKVMSRESQHQRSPTVYI